MNISYYDFHDGYLIDIKHIENKIEMFMESAQIHPDDMKDNLVLSKHETLKGKLHIENIKEIKVNDKPLVGPFKKTHDEGDIYDFELSENKVSLTINWIDHPAKPIETGKWCTYEIMAEKIYWENIPDLYNPYWP